MSSLLNRVIPTCEYLKFSLKEVTGWKYSILMPRIDCFVNHLLWKNIKQLLGPVPYVVVN